MNRALHMLPLLAFAAACGGSPPPNPPAPQPPSNMPPPAPVATTPPVRVTPDAPFRAQAPKPDGTVKFVPPKVTEAKLKNGLRVLVVERHELPIVSVRLVLTIGAGDIPDARPGLVTFLGGMLEQGTKKRTALEIDDAYEAIGAQHGAGFDWDSGSIGVKILADKLDPALDLMSDVALNAQFPTDEVERLRSRRIAGIKAEKASPGAAAANTVAAVLFGRAHTYGHNLSGEEEDAKKLTRADLVKTYERLFAPQNAALVVAGDVTQATLLPKLEAAFGGWKAKPGVAPYTRRSPKAPPKPATAKSLVFVDRPGAAQSQVQLVRVGVPYAIKNREEYVVTNAILGGMFTSRINMNLREKNGYTYGARSYFAMRHGAGPFLVAAPVHADKTGAAVKEIFTELDGLRKTGPTPDELALAKESIRLAMPGRFETASDVTNAVADLVVYDLPLDDFEKRLQRIDAVTADDVKHVATQMLVSKDMILVVVGDKKSVLPQLESLKLGDIDERDAYGDPLAAAIPPAKK